jgi:hypothetical protein
MVGTEDAEAGSPVATPGPAADDRVSLGSSATRQSLLTRPDRSLELPDERLQANPERPADVRKLDEVEPALTGLELADEGLWPVQPLGKGALRQAGSFPRLTKQCCESDLLWRVDGSAHR